MHEENERSPQSGEYGSGWEGSRGGYFGVDGPSSANYSDLIGDPMEGDKSKGMNNGGFQSDLNVDTEIEINGKGFYNDNDEIGDNWLAKVIERGKGFGSNRADRGSFDATPVHTSRIPLKTGGDNLNVLLSGKEGGGYRAAGDSSDRHPYSPGEAGVGGGEGMTVEMNYIPRGKYTYIFLPVKVGLLDP